MTGTLEMSHIARDGKGCAKLSGESPEKKLQPADFLTHCGIPISSVMGPRFIKTTSMKNITAQCTADGHLRYGHYDLELTDEEYAEFSQLDESGKKEWIRESGVFTLDNWCVNDTDIYEIKE